MPWKLLASITAIGPTASALIAEPVSDSQPAPGSDGGPKLVSLKKKYS